MDDPSPAGTVLIFSKGKRANLLDSASQTRLQVKQLKANLEGFTQALRELLPTVADAGGNFKLSKVEVAVGIDGKGNVGFLGTGVEVGAQATITLTFGS